MTTKNDGGPAFPTIKEDNGSYYNSNLGMTLRDWFAGKAGARFIAKFSAHQFDDNLFKMSAKAAYAFADAMIAERSK